MRTRTRLVTRVLPTFRTFSPVARERAGRYLLLPSRVTEEGTSTGEAQCGAATGSEPRPELKDHCFPASPQCAKKPGRRKQSTANGPGCRFHGTRAQHLPLRTAGPFSCGGGFSVPGDRGTSFSACFWASPAL